jgi:hypothetical protein
LAKYKKDDIDYSIMETDRRRKGENWQRITDYLKSDCVYLWEMVTEFIRRYGAELTQASAAMKQWIELSQMPAPQTDSEYYTALSPYYYGGRVECFESGIIDDDFDVYDINSAYPYAMLQRHPYSPNFDRINGYVNSADFVKVRCISRGAFPYRGLGQGKINAGLHFPNDDEIREYTVTHWEFKAAMDTQSIESVDVIESLVFMSHVDFRVYIEKFWAERDEAKKRGDVLASLMSKLMMNSLYGKFAANPENYQHYMIVPPDDIVMFDHPNNSKWRFDGELGPWILAGADLSDFEKRYYNVATGASITGFVRAMLWRAIHSSKGVLYCDTDSIAVRRKGKGVIISDKLGDWKHEGRFDRAGIAGKKLYIFRSIPDNEGKRHYKKASKGAKLTNAQLWKVASGGKVVYESEAPTFSVSKAPTFTKRVIINTSDRKGKHAKA